MLIRNVRLECSLERKDQNFVNYIFYCCVSLIIINCTIEFYRGKNLVEILQEGNGINTTYNILLIY